MHSLTPITDTASAVFLTCISRVRDPALKLKLTNIEAEIVRYDTDYVAAARKTELYSIPAHTTVGGTVTKDEMETVYDSRMVKADSPGRVYYDKILALSPHDRCPLCGQRLVATLDHYLPKAEFPALAVTPNNLVPACWDCNTTKKTLYATCVTKQSIHPYYDDVDAEVWLTAKILRQAPAVAIFSVTTPAGWSNILARRVRFHFKQLGLGQLYSSHAAGEISEIKFHLTKLLAAGGEEEVRQYLHEQWETRSAARKNSWQSALYKALSKNTWFCRAGCTG